MVLHQQGSENTDCVWFAPWIRAPMYKNRTKEWCPKDSRPTRQAWEKQRDIFSLSKAKRDFCRCWSEAQESKNPLLEFVQETQSKAMTQMCRPAGCPPPHFGEGVEGRQTMELSSKDTELLDSSETPWERWQQGGQWWRTLTERNSLFKRGFQSTFNAKDHFCEQEEGAFCQRYGLFFWKMVRKRTIPTSRW